ncbi:MAG TPA: hypothetical protein VFF96_00965 [Pseudoxanthomonas sp.]|nr:hypothetical protein [Pseudoxanthomonas sp.]
MKRQFGTFLTRLLRGATLTPAEHQIAERLVEELPNPLRDTVHSQFDAYNLVIREADGRALNFYRLIHGKQRPDSVPSFGMNGIAAPLIKMSFLALDDPNPIHATLTAVHGRAFCVSFNRRLDSYKTRLDLDTSRITRSWKSNIPHAEHV